MSKMNAKVNKLALCALLSAGVAPTVYGDPGSKISVDGLLGKSDIQLFNELQTRKGCEDALREVSGAFPGMGSGPEMDKLLCLAGDLNYLCGFWKWFDEVEPRNLDIGKLFSEDISGDQNLEDRGKLIFLRDVGWGSPKVREANKNDKKFGELEAACEGFI